MRGFLCDNCGSFLTGSPPGSFTFRLMLGGDEPRVVNLEGHLCDDCSIGFCQSHGLLEGELEGGEETP